MTKKKIAIAIAAAALAGTCAIGGTLAWLTSTDTVTNTFTVGKVDISISEPNTEFTDSSQIMLTPGAPSVKDPTITVEAGSVDSYVFAKVTNDFGDDMEIAYNTEKWVLVPTTGGAEGVSVYRYLGEIAATGATAKTLEPVFTSVTLKGDAIDVNGDSASSDIAAYFDGKDITIDAYAIQADGLTVEEGEEVWMAAYDTLASTEANGLPTRSNN